MYFANKFIGISFIFKIIYACTLAVLVFVAAQALLQSSAQKILTAAVSLVAEQASRLARLAVVRRLSSCGPQA